MNKNYSPKFSDEQLDRLARAVLQSTILTDEEIGEIAESPHLRWQMQSRIVEEKLLRKSRRFFIWRWQSALAGAFLVLFGATAAMWVFNSTSTEIAAVSDKENSYALQIDSPEIKPESPQSFLNSPEMTDAMTTRQRTGFVKGGNGSLKFASKPQSSRTESARRKIIKLKTDRSPKAEFATDFIALSYLPASESGQVVRVKVPRSMLVSLGVSTNVERGKELVNAEVIVGDDGAARAIRFLNE